MLQCPPEDLFILPAAERHLKRDWPVGVEPATGPRPPLASAIPPEDDPAGGPSAEWILTTADSCRSCTRGEIPRLFPFVLSSQRALVSPSGPFTEPAAMRATRNLSLSVKLSCLCRSSWGGIRWDAPPMSSAGFIPILRRRAS